MEGLIKVVKKRVWIIPVLILVIVSLVVGTFLAVQQSSLGEVELVGEFVYGTLVCSESPGSPVSTRLFDLPVGGKILSDINFAFSPRFDVLVEVPAYSGFDFKALRYRICEKANPTNCITDERIKLSASSSLKQTFDLGTVDNKHTVFFKLEDSKTTLGCLFLTAGVVANDNCWQDWNSMSGKYRVVYDNYALLRDDVLDGGQEFISETCSNPKSEAEKVKLELIVSTNLGDKSAFVQSVGVDRLKPNERWNYITGIVPVFEVVESFSGQSAICQNNQMYGLSEIKVVSGQTYRVVDQSKRLGSVTCCNGDVRLNEVCENHNFISIEGDVECNLINPCPINDYQIYLEDQSRTTVFRQSCVEGTCVSETKDVECASSVACDEGFNCVSFKCVRTGADEGTSFTDPLNDSDDSGSTGLNCEPLWVVGGQSLGLLGEIPELTIIPNVGCLVQPYILVIAVSLGVIAFLFSLLFLMKQYPNKKQKLLILGISGVLGFVAGFIFYLLWWAFLIFAIILAIVFVVLRFIKK